MNVKASGVKMKSNTDLTWDNTVSQVLRQLMQEANLKEAELARQTGLPQTTINRLLLGGTSDPRANTLKPLADFFCITIGQLCGFEPLSSHRIQGTTQASNRSAWSYIPIIHWEQVEAWKFIRKNTTPLVHKKWIGTERTLSEQAFALYSLAFMAPRFRKNSVLIVDPQAEYKDGHYVVVSLEQSSPTVRKILIDGSDILLKSFDQTQALVKLNKTQVIYGTIIESRMDTYDNQNN